MRWIISHLKRYTHLIIAYVLACILANILYTAIPIMTGLAFDGVLQHDQSKLLLISLVLLALVVLGGTSDLSARFFPELLGKRFARDARAELYLSLLGKSQTFHNRQRVGDIMARAANDMGQLSNMVVPGFDGIFDSFISLVIAIIFIGLLKWQLLVDSITLYRLIPDRPALLLAQAQPRLKQHARTVWRAERWPERIGCRY